MSLPSTYQHYVVAPGGGFDQLKLVKDAKLERPKRKQVLVRVHACSLQFRDLAVAKGLYPAQMKENLIPASDGAGEVVEVGEDVTKWKVGDRVIANFTQDQIAGPYDTTDYFASSLGAQADGMLSQYRLLPDYGLVKIPEHLSYEEASTLPCAALTAWNALFGSEKTIRPGQTALFQGTGGVSVFGAQLALLAGARVIITSSSDSKLKTVLKHLGEQAGPQGLKRVFTINYKTTPDWDKEALKLTGGVGVDHILEVGGKGTVEKSFGAIRQGGQIASIGVLSDADASDSYPNIGSQALFKAVTLRGILIGSRKQLESLTDAFAQSELRPLITKMFEWEDLKDAYQTQWDGSIIGKVVVRVA